MAVGPAGRGVPGGWRGGRRRDLVKGAAEPAWVGLGGGLRCQGPVRGPSPPRFSLSSPPPAGACSRPWHIWPGRTPSTRRTCSWCTMAPRAPAAPRARPGVPATWLPPPWKVRSHRAPCERQSHAVLPPHPTTTPLLSLRDPGWRSRKGPIPGADPDPGRCRDPWPSLKGVEGPGPSATQ